jgi:hypothetical protein
MRPDSKARRTAGDFFMSMTLIAIAAAAASHSVTIPHHGQSVGATYSARLETTSKTVGAVAGTRMDSRRCQWTATVVIDRRLDHGPAHARTIHTDQQFSGSAAGPCLPGHNPGAAVMVRNSDRIAAQLAAAAQADRAPLIAELDAARALASN